MAAIRREGTAPELAVAAALRTAGARPRANVRALPGTPDLVVGRVAVFVHGCFWHRCPSHWRMPRSNRAFWRRKFETNVRRDRRARRALNAAGWRVAVVWEHDDPARAAARVLRLNEARGS